MALGQGGVGRANLRATDSLPSSLSSVLCCFAFSLSQDWELPVKREVGGWVWSAVGHGGPDLCGWVSSNTYGWLRQGPRGTLGAGVTGEDHSGPCHLGLLCCVPQLCIP